jgi:7,8-dihydropterin-6-yl-methyl-4-(beta-D-ribofuranosyl)aminobenzene 5'-phosphate synthase
MILFDTGAKGNILLHNLNKLEIDPNGISKIVISHEHWDHKGGLKVLSRLFDNVDIYELVKVNSSINMDIKVPEKPEKITENIWTTGRIKGVVDEQSLVLNGKKGWFVLVGCSHPGVENILNIAKQFGDIIGLMGGFHGFNNFMVLAGLNVICPCHCTKNRKEIKERYPTSYIKGGIGRIIEI